jgi:nucleotide-binding universal stress UspA family protein
MNYKTVMVHLQIGRSNAGLLHIAGDLAERFQAGLIGVTVCQRRPIVYSEGYVAADLIEEDRKQLEDGIKAAENEFRSTLDARVSSLEWRSAITFGSLVDYLAQQARSADIVVGGVDQDVSMFDTFRHIDIGDFVLQAGRPVLVVPASVSELRLEHAIVAWKDTREARRAIYDALPLLRTAARVTVVEIVEGDFSAARDRLQDVVRWLERHGVEAGSIARSIAGSGAKEFSAVAEEQRADLIVAGAYGHSRLRAWVLGGFTREFLLRGDRCAVVSH